MTPSPQAQATTQPQPQPKPRPQTIPEGQQQSEAPGKEKQTLKRPLRQVDSLMDDSQTRETCLKRALLYIDKAQSLSKDQGPLKEIKEALKEEIKGKAYASLSQRISDVLNAIKAPQKQSQQPQEQPKTNQPTQPVSYSEAAKKTLNKTTVTQIPTKEPAKESQKPHKNKTYDTVIVVFQNPPTMINPYLMREELNKALKDKVEDLVIRVSLSLKRNLMVTVKTPYTAESLLDLQDLWDPILGKEGPYKAEVKKP